MRDFEVYEKVNVVLLENLFLAFLLEVFLLHVVDRLLEPIDHLLILIELALNSFEFLSLVLQLPFHALILFQELVQAGA